MSQIVLALNAGSSTLKFAAYSCEGDRPEARIISDTLEPGAAPASIELVLERLRQVTGSVPARVAHRIVHGGAAFTAPVQVDDSTLEQLDQLVELAPLHLPPALALLRQARERLPQALHVACFDTAFHRTLPEVARRFALPSELYERGVRRYGFHGLSYEYVLSTFGAAPPRRLIVAHLGSGASLTAISEGRSIDTSMGLTPAGGIPMGTRSGDLDPGVCLHFLREGGRSLDDLERLVNHASGLKGLAGSADMIELTARARAGDAPAMAALELFAYAIKKQLGAYWAVLGGLDCLVFTGGIGEHAPLVRQLACRGLEGLGLELDEARNWANAPLISSARSACEVRVVATDEDAMLARAARALVPRPQGSSGGPETRVSRS